MIIFPAIDIKEGKVVRLLQGKFDEVTQYGEDPVDMARHWESKGAQWLHLVDLDGAQTGEIRNLDVIVNIAKTVNIPVQMGGGIRTKEDIEKLINGGVSRVILGTKIVEDRNFLKEILDIWKEKIAVSLDCHNGMVAQRGWTSTSNLKATEFAKELQGLGLTCLIYTDIARDGMLSGPNFESLKELLETVQIPIIASGGVANLEDIKKLSSLESDGLIGAITGKAIYEGKLDLEEALQLLNNAN